MSSLKAAIRPTLRDVKHHPLRSLAAILLIALPATYAAFLIGDTTSESQSMGSHPTEFRPVLRQRMPAKR